MICTENSTQNQKNVEGVSDVRWIAVRWKLGGSGQYDVIHNHRPSLFSPLFCFCVCQCKPENDKRGRPRDKVTSTPSIDLEIGSSPSIGHKSIYLVFLVSVSANV